MSKKDGSVSLGTSVQFKSVLSMAMFTKDKFPEPGLSGGDAESFYGNVQVEIGSNDDINFCGKNRSKAHLGHCMLNTSLYLDDTLFIDKGVFVQEIQ